MITLEHAISISSKAHEGQIDKVGEPYILHPLRVMLALSTPVERIVGVMHDVLEDTHLNVEYLKSQGCDEVIITSLLSVTKRIGETWMGFIARAAADPIGQRVKRADISDNASPVRLFRLDSDTRERLFKKYSRAIEYLDCHNHIKEL